MTATIHHIPASDPEPRRSVRDQDESLTGYLARIGEQAPPASAGTIAAALVHYSGEHAGVRRTAGMPLTTADGQVTASVTEIYWAGWNACADAMTEALAPHLHAVTLADVTAASATVIQEAAG